VRKLIAAVALLSLAGCHAFVAEHYHPTGAFPPTPNAEQAVDVCHSELLREYAAEETVANLGGPIVAASTGVLAREMASFKDCMERHGYEHNS
jgi:hypothetical protein